jgi:hypothetical protein
LFERAALDRGIFDVLGTGKFEVFGAILMGAIFSSVSGKWNI